MENHVISAHRIPVVFNFRGEESSFSYPGHEDMVALPEIEIQYAFVRDLFQPPFGRVDQFTTEIARCEHKDIPIIAFEFGKQQQAA